MPNIAGSWSDDHGDGTITTRYFLPGRVLQLRGVGGYDIGNCGKLAFEPTIDGLDRLRDIRRGAATEVGNLHVFNKSLQAAKQYDDCKALKPVIQYFTQLEKAATLVIGWALDIGDKRTANWPQEFADLIDYAYHVAVETVQDKQGSGG